MAAARATSAAYVVVSPRSATAARSPTRVAVSHSIRAKLGLKSAEVRKGAQGPNQTGGRAATLVPRGGERCRASAQCRGEARAPHALMVRNTVQLHRVTNPSCSPWLTAALPRPSERLERCGDLGTHHRNRSTARCRPRAGDRDHDAFALWVLSSIARAGVNQEWRQKRVEADYGIPGRNQS